MSPDVKTLSDLKIINFILNKIFSKANNLVIQSFPSPPQHN